MFVMNVKEKDKIERETNYKMWFRGLDEKKKKKIYYPKKKNNLFLENR